MLTEVTPNIRWTRVSDSSVANRQCKVQESKDAPLLTKLLANSSCSWICPIFGLPNFSVSFIDNSLHSLCSLNSFDPLNDYDTEVSPPQPNCKQTSTKTPRLFKRNPNPRKLTCVVIDCRSLKNKFANTAAVIDKHESDVNLGNKSWLNSEIKSSAIFPEVYAESRKDRVDGQNGDGIFQAFLKM